MARIGVYGSRLVRAAVSTVVLFALAFVVPKSVRASCPAVPGDVTGDSTTNVQDVVCTILGTLSEMAGQAPPDCAVAPLDHDCNGNVDVSDVLLTIRWALGLPLSPQVDANANGCVDACEPPPPPPQTCCSAHPSPGCGNAACETCVVQYDPFCTSAFWDDVCTHAAQLYCASACGCAPPQAACGNLDEFITTLWEYELGVRNGGRTWGYVLKTPVPAGTVLEEWQPVDPDGPPPVPAWSMTANHDTWVAYLDDMPHARFEHPTRAFVCDAVTGEVQVFHGSWPIAVDDLALLEWGMQHTSLTTPVVELRPIAGGTVAQGSPDCTNGCEAGDYGDAPDGVKPKWYSAANANYPTLADHEGAHALSADVVWLGMHASTEAGTSDPNDPDGAPNQFNGDDDDVAYVVLYDRVSPWAWDAALLASVTAAPESGPMPVYLNALVDVDESGTWQNEWVISNEVFDAVPGQRETWLSQHFAFALTSGPLCDVWIRLTVTTEPVLGDPTTGDWDGTGVWAFGEVEDGNPDLRVPKDQCPNAHEPPSLPGEVPPGAGAAPSGQSSPPDGASSPMDVLSGGSAGQTKAKNTSSQKCSLTPTEHAVIINGGPNEEEFFERLLEELQDPPPPFTSQALDSLDVNTRDQWLLEGYLASKNIAYTTYGGEWANCDTQRKKDVADSIESALELGLSAVRCPDPLYVFLVAHGSDDGRVLLSGCSFTMQEVAKLIKDKLKEEQHKKCATGKVPCDTIGSTCHTRLFISTCFSGKFEAYFSGKDALDGLSVAVSAGSDEEETVPSAGGFLFQAFRKGKRQPQEVVDAAEELKKEYNKKHPNEQAEQTAKRLFNKECDCPCGACCSSDKSCVMVGYGAANAKDAKMECEASGGEYKGDGSQCQGVLHPWTTIDWLCVALGACCMPSGECVAVSADECDAAGGAWSGAGTECAGDLNGDGFDDMCPVPGACCLPSGECIDMGEATCTEAGGVWLGAATDCLDPLITKECTAFGACLLKDGTCAFLSFDECLAAAGSWLGEGTPCPVPPGGEGACCLPDGQCAVMPGVECESTAGAWQGEGTQCQGDVDGDGVDDACVPTTACCLLGDCVDITPADCTAKGGVPLGAGSTCASDWTTCLSD